MAERAELDDRHPVDDRLDDVAHAPIDAPLTATGTPDMAKVAAAIDDAASSDLDAALELDAAIRLASERPAEWRRVRKWDRPRDPRDWRYFVGLAGRIMLATGILMFGFVAYQLWGTGIETARAQNALEDQFAAVLADQAARPADVDEPAADDATDAATADDATGEPRTPTEAGVDTADDPSADAATEPADAAAADPPSGDPVIPVARDLADDAVEQDLPEITRGDVLARLEIPRIDQDVFVVPGVRIDDLKDGPGHYPDTPLPGQLGNAAIAGHRTTYGSPFFDVDQLQPGDELIVTMVTGDRFVYEVTGTEIVEATDYWVVSTTNPDTAELTLTSCHPKYSARQRIIVRSVLNPDKSSQVGFPTTYDLDTGDDTPIPGDDPVIEAAEPQIISGEATSPTEPDSDGLTADAPLDAAPTPTASPVTEAPASETSEPTDRGAADEAAVAAPVEAAGFAAGDDFARGWFDDDAAWPQILLWGLVLVAIAMIAFRISRRFRRDLVGAAIGVAPFAIALYFFFQNVHRLLPPGI